MLQWLHAVGPRAAPCRLLADCLHEVAVPRAVTRACQASGDQH